MRNNNYFYVWIGSYIIGLLLTGLFSLSQGFFFSITVLIITIIACFFLPKWRKLKLNIFTCFVTGLILLSGFYYLHWRTPTPDNLDISHQITSSSTNHSTPVTVTGLIVTTPRLNQNNNAKFVLKAQQISDKKGNVEKVTGKVYVTVPLLQITGLYPSQIVKIRGQLYIPNPPLNPGGFDFGGYLKREGIFAGLSADSIQMEKQGNWWAQNLFNFRQRIIQTHVRFLNVPYGSLVSSMVIGSRAVDLNLDLQNAFRTAGLAHTLAASGFHVSLLLGCILSLTQSYSPRIRLIIGLLSLLMYATLTGFFPSILRASFMGVTILIAIINDRSVKTYASLFLSAFILLLINPLWIWDLGFQLSFLATWGLIITLPAIVNKLDFLPPTIANLIAVPLAATIWTLPLQCYAFHRIPVYGILTNILATPLVIIITLGGIFSAIVGVFIPLIGSTIAYILFIPTWLLINLVKISNKLPFSSLAVGEISLLSFLFAYGILVFITFNKWGQKNWLKLTLFSLILFIIPLIYQKFNLIQVTVIASRDQPVIIVQNQTNHAVINLNDKNNVRFNIVAFLINQGINQLDLVLIPYDADNIRALDLLKQYINIKNISLREKEAIKSIHIISQNPNYFHFQLANKTWLLITKNQNINLPTIIKTDILIWDGKSLNTKQFQQIKTKIAIVNTEKLKEDILKYLSVNNIQILSLKKGAIQWQPKTGFKIYNNDVM
ncbi:ComEC/Rec2 family competence protein [Geminocystis sp. GBBB08]|uniref:ComEC/Rec2 family competence protein n=1 Tax=Geminocystis sp. GBBB08 TaxID=2604140 RepID=UPI0027E28CB8|nr:ComEC/Rec2 family competence protein [Geminocystis sp. GBBB08]MBL1211252.1 ComEC family competence protein [Geminocystis sp. GBBB08]